MRRTAIRVWFALAAAVVAAAVADPCVEAASNAGWFGPGNFTDHSNLDVIPALFAGAALVAIYLALRVRRELLAASNQALRDRFRTLIPVIFALQLATLFAMETTEQLVVDGRLLGGTVWLGGPVWFSLIVHAVTGLLVTIGLAYVVRVGARTTVRVIRQMRALALRARRNPLPLALRRREHVVVAHPPPVCCRTGDRAPPFAFV